MVIVDRKDYINKAKKMLEQWSTYRPIPLDPTNKQKAKLINILKRIKAETGMDDITCKKVYLTGESSPKFNWLLKIYKKDNPLRPIVANRDSVTNGVVKELARVLKPLFDNSTHHVNNTKEFMEHVKNITLEEGVHHIIWCNYIIYINTNGTSIKHKKDVYTTPVSYFKSSSVNRFEVQPVDHLSAPLWQNFIWKILNAEA